MSRATNAAACRCASRTRGRVRDAQRHAAGFVAPAHPRRTGAVLAGGTDRRRDRADDRRGVVIGAGPVRRSAREAGPGISLADSAGGTRARIVRPSDAAEAHQPAPVSPIEDNGARFRRGLLIHALLAYLPGVDEGEREVRALAYLKREGIAPAEAKEIVASVSAFFTIPSSHRCSRRKAAPKSA